LGGILTGKSLSTILLGLEGSGKSLVAGNITAALIQQDSLARVDTISESVSARSSQQEEGLGLFEARGHKRCRGEHDGRVSE
jgi:hypothetical protein